MTAQVEWLEVMGDRDVWRSLGLVVGDDGVIPLMGTCLRITESWPGGSVGIVGWALSGLESDWHELSIDGLATSIVEAAGPMFAQHELGASGLDHVVVMTSDLERTTDSIAAATGCELKRIREVGSMRQGFHRIGRGGLVVEVVEQRAVERSEVDSSGVERGASRRSDAHDVSASFWGLVINVDDLDAACERIGVDRISPPKDAVQPGRRIATISKDVGLGVPVALMTT